MFRTVLVACRGEIAVRITRTLRRLGITSVAVHTDADSRARHVRDADLAVHVDSYLNIDAVLTAARRTGAEAVHPGYGFLAENSAFARACTDAGLVFVGPPATAIEAMGDKIRAKRTVAEAGVPVVPGSTGSGLSDAELAREAERIGLPVLLKPSAGGGGKGMRMVRHPADLADAIAAARREARGAFGDDTLLVERFVNSPRHIEIQIFADGHGNAVHLGERECSLQRRHQKIVEEAPSPLIDEATRERMGSAAVAVARAVGYVGAGTVEYIVSADRPQEFFFMEMNTRLQVEHPVTELATELATELVPEPARVAVPRRLDLVELQLRVAAGEALPFSQEAIGFNGHAVEARIYAEEPSRGFLPTGGRVLTLSEPTGPGIRVDSGIAEGDEIGSAYDPMLAKVIAWGPDRESALSLLDRALASYALLGVPTNVAFLRELLAHPDVAAGRLDTGLVERAAPALMGDGADRRSTGRDTGRHADRRHADRRHADRYEHVLAAAALERMLALEPDGPVDPWRIPDGWRQGDRAWTRWSINAGGRDPVEVRCRGLAGDGQVSVDGGEPVPARAWWEGPGVLAVTYADRTIRYACARHGDVCWLGHDGYAWALTEHTAAEAAGTRTRTASGLVRSPMPGTVLVVKAAEGDVVAEGQPLVIVEAMKMEHTVVAPAAGVISRLPARPGAQVRLDQALAEIAPVDGGDDENTAGGTALRGDDL